MENDLQAKVKMKILKPLIMDELIQGEIEANDSHDLEVEVKDILDYYLFDSFCFD
jgi:hypothetical protein